MCLLHENLGGCAVSTTDDVHALLCSTEADTADAVDSSGGSTRSDSHALDAILENLSGSGIVDPNGPDIPAYGVLNVSTTEREAIIKEGTHGNG